MDLRQGLRILPTGFADYEVTSPPAVIGDAIVVGSAISDGTGYAHPSGEVRAFHAVTGKLLWSWDPVPQDSGRWRRYLEGWCGAGCWWRQRRGRSLSPTSRGISCSSRRAAPSRLLRRRADGDNLFSDRWWRFALILAHASGTFRPFTMISGITTSQRRQSSSNGARTGGRSRRSPSRPKSGHLFILNRLNGEPLIPIEERPVPQSDVPGETSSRTQPFPTAPASLAPTALAADAAWAATDADRAWCRSTIAALRSDGHFTPPSVQGSLVIPGNVGGVAWGGMATTVSTICW